MQPIFKYSLSTFALYSCISLSMHKPHETSKKNFLTIPYVDDRTILELKKIPIKNRLNVQLYTNEFNSAQYEYKSTKNIRVLSDKIQNIFNKVACNNPKIINFQKPLIQGIETFKERLEYGYLNILKNHIESIYSISANYSGSYVTGFPFQVTTAIQLSKIGKKIFGFELFFNHTLEKAKCASFDIICTNKFDALDMTSSDKISIKKNVKDLIIELYECKALDWLKVSKDHTKNQTLLQQISAQNEIVKNLQKDFPDAKISFTLLSLLPIPKNLKKQFKKNNIDILHIEKHHSAELESESISIPSTTSHQSSKKFAEIAKQQSDNSLSKISQPDISQTQLSSSIILPEESDTKEGTPSEHTDSIIEPTTQTTSFRLSAHATPFLPTQLQPTIMEQKTSLHAAINPPVITPLPIQQYTIMADAPTPMAPQPYYMPQHQAYPQNYALHTQQMPAPYAKINPPVITPFPIQQHNIMTDALSPMIPQPYMPQHQAYLQNYALHTQQIPSQLLHVTYNGRYGQPIQQYYNSNDSLKQMQHIHSVMQNQAILQENLKKFETMLKK